MARKNCNEEFAIEKQKVKALEKLLYGNGTNGLVRTIKDLSDDMIVQKERNSIKMWIYRSTIAVLISLSTFLLTRIYYIKFGG